MPRRSRRSTNRPTIPVRPIRSNLREPVAYESTQDTPRPASPANPDSANPSRTAPPVPLLPATKFLSPQSSSRPASSAAPVQAPGAPVAMPVQPHVAPASSTPAPSDLTDLAAPSETLPPPTFDSSFDPTPDASIPDTPTPPLSSVVEPVASASEISPITPALPPLSNVRRSAASPTADEVARAQHRQRRQRERAKLRRTVFLSIVLGIGLFIFVATAGIHYQRLVAQMPQGQPSTASRSTLPSDDAISSRSLDALALMDEAATAKTEKRYDDAEALANRALAADPSIKGTGTLFAELAFYRGKDLLVERIARESLVRDDIPADAHYLLAVSQWAGRLLPGAKKLSELSEDVFLALDASTLDAYSNFDPFLFRADLEGQLGRPYDAQRSIRAARARLEPWHSHTLLNTKLRLAQAEAGIAAADDADPVAAAALSLRRALATPDSDPAPARDALRGALTKHQFDTLLQDAALAAQKDNAEKKLKN